MKARGLALATAALVGFSALCWKLIGPGHETVNTKADLALICQAIADLGLAEPPDVLRSSLSNLDARKLYGILCKPSNGSPVLRGRPEWNSVGELTDRWGNPYHVRVAFVDRDRDRTNQASVARVTIWSAGSNGRDEGGKGDDIGAGPFDVGIAQ